MPTLTKDREFLEKASNMHLYFKLSFFGELKKSVKNWLVSGVGKDIAINARGLRFGSLAGQIRHSITNGSPPPWYFFGAALLITQTLSRIDRSRHA